MLPHMSTNEINMFKTYLQKAAIYFEYGSGGSTYFAVNNGVKKIYSVESDPQWTDKLKQQLNNDIVSFIHIDIGSTGAWGYPTTSDNISNYPLYSKAIDQITEKIDLVLVDGRFRVACICRSLLKLDPNSFILVHDFWNRPQYHVVLPYLDVIDRVDSLAVFKPKSNLNSDEIVALWQQYKNITV